MSRNEFTDMANPIECFERYTSSKHKIVVKRFSELPYLNTQQVMANFSQQRDKDEGDQIWLLQHPPVYTQGTACQQVPLNLSAIEVVKSDRGGQITYHGPGQIVMYPLLNIRRHGLGVKLLVETLEQAVINVLNGKGVDAMRKLDAPGVYVDGEKIAALGLRIRRGNSYHGLSLNVAMDLAPFKNIDPCGFQGLQVTQVVNHVDNVDISALEMELLDTFIGLL